MTQLGAVAFGESPGHPEKSTITGDAELFGEQNRLAAHLAVVLAHEPCRDAADCRGNSVR